MVRWVACDHVVDGPVVTLKVFATSSAYWFKYGLGVGSCLFPFFTAMPVSHYLLNQIQCAHLARLPLLSMSHVHP